MNRTRPPHGFLFFAIALLALPCVAAAQQSAICRAGTTGTTLCSSPWSQGWIPTGIDATKIAAGTVNNTEFGYLDGLTGNVQAAVDQINTAIAVLGPGLQNRVLASPNGISGSPSLRRLVYADVSDFVGSVANTIAAGNDPRLPPTPGTTGAIVTDTGAAYTKIAPSALVGLQLTSNGTGLQPSYQQPITNDGGCSTLGAGYNVTASYANVGLSRLLGSAGKWVLDFDVRTLHQASSGTGGILVRLHDGSAAVTDSVRTGGYSTAPTLHGSTVSIHTEITVLGPTTINLQAQREPATYSSALIVSDGSGYTVGCSRKVGI